MSTHTCEDRGHGKSRTPPCSHLAAWLSTGVGVSVWASPGDREGVGVLTKHKFFGRPWRATMSTQCLPGTLFNTAQSR